MHGVESRSTTVITIWNWLCERYPLVDRVAPILIIAVLVLLLVFMGILVVRAYRGDPVAVFNIVRIGQKDAKAVAAKLKRLETDVEVRAAAMRASRDACIAVCELTGQLSQLDPVNIDAACKETVNQVLHLFSELIGKREGNVSRMSVWIPLESDTSFLRALTGLGFRTSQLEGRCLSIAKSYAGRAWSEGIILRTGNVKKEKVFERNPASRNEYYSLMCAPLVYRETRVGVLSIDGTLKNAFTKDDELAFDLCASHVATVLRFRSVALEREQRRRRIHGQETAATQEEGCIPLSGRGDQPGEICQQADEFQRGNRGGPEDHKRA